MKKTPVQNSRPTSRWAASSLLLMLALYFTDFLLADSPTHIAKRARLDLLAEPSVGKLSDVHVIGSDGDAKRMDWLEKSAQPRSITVEFSIWPLGWREFELRFTPARSGEVKLELLGPWQELDGKLLKLDVLWDAVRAQGAQLTNGSFEQSDAGKITGWEMQGGTVERATLAIAAVDAKHVARTWHDGRLVATLRVTEGRPVVLRGHARAVFPAGFVEMRRIESRDTPAHLAARRFLRGVNLANYLEAPVGEDWGARYSADDLEPIRQEGFDHVRIPIGWQYYTGPAPGYTLRPAIFEKVDVLVREALKRGLNVIVNIQHFEDFTSDPKNERARFLAIWRQLAKYYADRDAGLAFELLNEPKDAATTEVINDIYSECIREIRLTNPQRTIFVGPGLWNASDELPKLKLPDNETNVIVTIHSYAPMYFTHQGAPWNGPDFALTGVRFPGPPATPLTVPASRKMKPYVLEWIERYNTLPEAENPSSPRAFATYFEQARQWSDYYGRPIHVGEFGAFDKADDESRAHYCRAVREQLETGGIGWALWDWKAGFRYWDVSAKRPMPGMREALFGK